MIPEISQQVLEKERYSSTYTLSYSPINPSLEGNTISKVVFSILFSKSAQNIFLAYSWAKLLTQSDGVCECGRTGPHLCTHSWGRVTQKTQDGVFEQPRTVWVQIGFPYPLE